MQTFDSILSVEHLKIVFVAIAFLILMLWGIKIVRKIRANILRVQKNKEELKRIQILRENYKQDITTFLNSYRNDISTRLEESKAENGLFIFWSGAEEVFKKFQSDTSEINRLPNQEERIAIRSFYTEVKAFLDGILYNNYLLKKYQYLHCKVKTTTATSKEVREVDDITQQMSTLGAQLQQQHHELLNSLQTAKAYF
jgi:Zn-dependent oligopeptidase